MPPRQVKRKLIIKKPSTLKKVVPPVKAKPVIKKQSTASAKSTAVIKKGLPQKVKFVEVPNVPQKLPSVPSPGVVAVRTPAWIEGETLEQKLRRMACDPEELLAMVMVGDVVGLGLMSQEELDQNAIFNTDGIQLTPSGRDRARAILDSKIRAKAIVDALPYLRSKKNEGVTKKGDEDEEAAVLYIPDNGRSK